MAAVVVCDENDWDIARFHVIFFKKRIHFKQRETNCLRKLQNKGRDSQTTCKQPQLK